MKRVTLEMIKSLTPEQRLELANYLYPDNKWENYPILDKDCMWDGYDLISKDEEGEMNGVMQFDYRLDSELINENETFRVCFFDKFLFNYPVQNEKVLEFFEKQK